MEIRSLILSVLSNVFFIDQYIFGKFQVGIHKTLRQLVSYIQLSFHFFFFVFCSQIDKLEGDIKLSPNVVALVAEGVRRRKRPHTTRGAVNNKIYLWSNGQVPYEIDSVFGKCFIQRS